MYYVIPLRPLFQNWYSQSAIENYGKLLVLFLFINLCHVIVRWSLRLTVIPEILKYPDERNTNEGSEKETKVRCNGMWTN